MALFTAILIFFFVIALITLLKQNDEIERLKNIISAHQENIKSLELLNSLHQEEIKSLKDASQ